VHIPENDMQIIFNYFDREEQH
jgi:Ca2+-binding EF-hand superfamily protein